MTTPFHSTLALLFILERSLAVGLMIWVVSRRKTPAVTLAWVLAFFSLPFLGETIYAFFGVRGFRRRLRPKPNPRRYSHDIPPAPTSFPLRWQGLERLAWAKSGFAACSGNNLTILQDTATDDALFHAIANSRHHVHLEYYILASDPVGKRYIDLLCQKTREGVECRLLLDAVGSRCFPRQLQQRLSENGVQWAWFNPLRFWKVPWGHQMRNHRKLSILDGCMGLMGSQNLALESLPGRFRPLEWKETDVQVEGAAVGELQAVFAEDWRYATGEQFSGKNYFPPLESASGVWAQVVPTGPDGSESTLDLLFLEAVHAAQHRITLTTPYFIPTPALLLALESATRRGVAVELMVPARSDHPLLDLAGRSWFDELSRMGVKVLENTQSFVHSKVMTVDEELSLLGSANMDSRSFQINFEVSLLLYDRASTRRLLSIFNDERPSLRPYRPHPNSFLQSLAQGTARLLSPLL